MQINQKMNKTWEVTDMSMKIDGILAEVVNGSLDAAASVPGVVAIAADSSGVIYEGAAGERRLGSGEAMRTDQVLWIHSMTKPVTGAACMQLVEQGKIGLDDDCGALVPALNMPDVLEGFDDQGKPILRPARGVITLRNLLTHTSGYVYDMWNADQRAWIKAHSVKREDIFGAVADRPPLAFDPGTRWQYGVGIDWAGKVLEAVTGEALNDYVQANICKPLGMASTGYLLTDALRARLAGVHQRGGDGAVKAVDFDPPQNPAHFNGGGGMYSTAPDYACFMRMMLNGGSLDGAQILKPETVALMGQNHIGDVLVEKLNSCMPHLTCDAEFYPGMAKKWGLTFMINQDDVPGARRAGSLAWAGLRNSYFWIDPKSDLSGAIFTQQFPFADLGVLALLDRFERAVYAHAGKN